MATIDIVFSTKNLQTYSSTDILSKYDEKTLFQLRTDLKKDKKGVLLCATCMQPLFIAGTLQGDLYFRHTKDSDDCPIKTTCKLNPEEIQAMKYNGQKEGARHKNNKLLLASILKKDPTIESVEVEKTFKEENEFGIAKHWRRPDITAIFKNGLTMVFELQVSTTFLDVIIARDEFYKRNNASIMWVFLEFNNDTFTQKDIFYNSGLNAFVFDELAATESNKTGKLHFNCHYVEYLCQDVLGLNQARLEMTYRNKLISIDELKLDPKTNKPYYFDVANNKVEIAHQVNERTKALKAKFQQEMEQAKKKFNRAKAQQPLPSEKYQTPKVSIEPKLYEELKTKGKLDKLKCTSCGNTKNFRSVACFISCNDCNATIDW